MFPYSQAVTGGNMRWLIRMLLFWAICAPLFYVYGLPYMLDMLSKKAQGEALSQCVEQMRSQNMFGQPDSPMTGEMADKYCHCVADDLILTKNDVFELVQKKPATALTALSQALTTKCNEQLKQDMATPPQSQVPAAPPEDSRLQPLGM